MKTRNSWIWVIGLLLAPSLAAETLTRFSVMNGQHLSVEFHTVIEPNNEGVPEKNWGGGAKVGDDGVFHRYLLDRRQKVYAGYDLRIEESGEEDRLRLTLGPLSLPADELSLDGPGWTALPIVRGTQIREVTMRESLALDLLVRPSSGQKVSEYISVGRTGQNWSRSVPRPFRAEEAEMELTSPRLFLNGEEVAKDPGTVSAGGATVGLYWKNRGRFVFSLLPYPELGFEQAGMVAGSMLEFEWGGETFRIECGRRIAPGGGAFHIYARHDPAYQPEPGMNRDFFVFAAGKPTP